MLIGIDASRANRLHKTGTEWYSYYLIRWFARLDKKNQYILYTDEPLRNGLADLAMGQDYSSILDKKKQKPIFDKDGFQIIKSPYNNFRGRVLDWSFKYLWTQARFSYEMLVNAPDVLFVPAHTLPIVHPKNTVNTIHDIAFARFEKLYDCHSKIGPDGRGARKTLDYLIKLMTNGKCGINSVDYLRWSTRYSLKKARKIITISNFSYNDILDYYGDKFRNKIKVVYNGYNKDLYRVDNNKANIGDILDKYCIEEPYFFYIGRLEKKKNIPNLIKAFALAKNKYKLKHKLVLVGDVGYGFDEIKLLITQKELEDDVIMPGWVDEVDVPHLYKAADAFVFPSCYEGFGIPILQAMACGVPVVASNATSIPEVAGGAARLFELHNVDSMAEAMHEVVSNKEKRQDFIKKGLKRAEEFSWKKSAEETLDVLIDNK